MTIGILSPGTQQLNRTESVVSSGATDVFTFPNPPTGFVWGGTLSVNPVDASASTPASALFTVEVGGTNWGSWGGSSVFGPVQANQSQQLVVTATGLLAGVSYVCSWIGSADPGSLVQPLHPAANASALTALVQGVPPQFLAKLTAALALPVPVPVGIRTILLNIIPNTLGEICTNVQVYQDGGSLFPFYNQPPYLFNTLGGGYYYQVIVPVFPIGYTTNLEVTVTLSSGTAFIEAFGDSAQYDESVFYNGTARTTEVGAGTTLLAGPARILSLNLVSGAGGGYINLGAGSILNTAGAGQVNQLAFGGHGIVLPAGSSLSTSPNVAAATAVWAYP